MRNNMTNIKHILERQEKEMEVLLYDFADNATDNEGMVDSKDSGDFKEKSKDIKDWHTASIKEILKGVKEFVRNNKPKYPPNSEREELAQEQIISDTITHLESLIKQL